MSAFITRLAVAIDDATIWIPKGSFIESITWNGTAKELEIKWQHHLLQTPFTYHLEYPLDILKQGHIPNGVTVRRPTIPTPGTPPPKRKAVDKGASPVNVTAGR